MQGSSSVLKCFLTLMIPTLAVGSILAPCDGISGNLLQNCGFETGDFTGWTQSGNTDSTFAFGSFDGFSPNSGSDFGALGPAGDDGYLGQMIATRPGDAYTISWYLASDAQTPNDFNVTWDGNSIFSQTDLTVPDWVLYSFNEVASGSSTTLTFRFSDDLGYLALDDTSVTDSRPANNNTPEPATSYLLAVTGTVFILGRRMSSRMPWSYVSELKKPTCRAAQRL